jgi:PTH2 family peptidyl-tRNA hydrolase
MAFRFASAPQEEYKLVVLVRNDLKMGKGKIAAQVGHAAVECALFAEKKNKRAFDAWYASGQRKVVLKVEDLEELQSYVKLASSNGLHVALITDAGRTQVDPGTVTCLGIGPAPESEIDRITGELKMLRSFCEIPI